MNRIFSVLIVASLMTGFAFAQSLGDVARQNRQARRKPAAHVYTNDDIPSQPTMKAETATNPDEQAKDSADKKKVTGESAANADSEKNDKNPDEAKRKLWDGYKSKVADQKSKISLLQRELDVLQKENQIQLSSLYADLGTKLRDPKAWNEQQQKNQDGLDAKSKELQSAQDALQSIQDEGAKQGVPSSYLD